MTVSLKVYNEMVAQFSEYFWNNSHVSDTTLNPRKKSNESQETRQRIFVSGERQQCMKIQRQLLDSEAQWLEGKGSESSSSHVTLDTIFNLFVPWFPHQ